jgi:hypothetical protein
VSKRLKLAFRRRHPMGPISGSDGWRQANEKGWIADDPYYQIWITKTGSGTSSKAEKKCWMINATGESHCHVDDAITLKVLYGGAVMAGGSLHGLFTRRFAWNI